MTTSWTFDSNLSPWSITADVVWTGSYGFPSAGAADFNHTGGNDGGSMSINPGHTVVLGDFLSFYYRSIASSITCFNGWVIDCQLTVGGTALSLQPACTSAGDSGWQLASLDLGPYIGGTVTLVQILTINQMNINGHVYVDYVSLGPELPAPTPPGLPEVRYLGIAADNANVYRASINGGTLTLDYIALTDPSTVVDSFTFGTCAFTAPDSYTRAIYPVVVADKELYLYGRDASGVQVQYNDLNGSLGWLDAGPGTATWATTKFCVALMPQPVAPRNLIAAFADNDIWTTVTGSDGIWTHSGDAGTALRTAGRVTTEFDRFLVAGQGTAQTYFSQNYGVSFSNAFSGLAGTVNAFEVSR